MVHRIFDAIDGALSAVVPLLYLIGVAAGMLAYFSGILVQFDVAVGVCLAVAAECHAYLTQRRMRMARARLNRATVRDEAYGQPEAIYTHQRNILIALIAFSTYNSVQFVASTWHPSGWLPGWLQILVRGAIVPGLFYLAGELTPPYHRTWRRAGACLAGDDLRRGAHRLPPVGPQAPQGQAPQS